MQKPNANNYADIKTSVDNLQFPQRNQLQQTPSYKIGGGGARAARRIQIRRPRLAERGARGVSDTSADFCRLQSLRRTPPYPPTLPQNSRLATFCRPSGLKMQTFGRLFADQKFIKNQSPPKPSQNHKNPTLERQMSDL